MSGTRVQTDPCLAARSLWVVSAAFVLGLALLSACAQLRPPDLNEGSVTRYVRALQALRRSAAGFVDRIGQFRPAAIDGLPDAQRGRLEALVRREGFADLRAFSILNVRIIALYRSLGADRSAERAAERTARKSEARLRLILSRARLPKRSRDAIHRALANMANMRARRREHFRRMREFRAETVADDSAALALVRRHRDELAAVIDGGAAQIAARKRNLEQLKRAFLARLKKPKPWHGTVHVRPRPQPKRPQRPQR